MIISAQKNIIDAEHIYNIQEKLHTKLQIVIQWKIYDTVNIPCGSTKSCSLINCYDQHTKDSRSPAMKP